IYQCLTVVSNPFTQPFYSTETESGSGVKRKADGHVHMNQPLVEFPLARIYLLFVPGHPPYQHTRKDDKARNKTEHQVNKIHNISPKIAQMQSQHGLDCSFHV